MKLKTVFQDEDFSLGEVADVSIATMPDGRIVARAKAKSGGEHTFYYDNLKTFANDWEDYEEPKGFWMINILGIVEYTHGLPENEVEMMKEIGNYFDTREEAEKAMEKLKAWKRLREANIDYKLSREYDDFTETMHANVSFSFNSYPLVGKDLDLLFFGEDGDV